MPVKEFLDKFLPVSPPSMPKNEPSGFEAMTGVETESNMYNEFAKVANEICRSLRAVNTSMNPSDGQDSHYSPDITFYDVKKTASQDSVTSFQSMELFIKFKHEDGSDPFNDNGGPFGQVSDTACETRGKITLYSTLQQTWQFRAWTFSVAIFGNVARLFRWDRAGAIVSAPISYCKEGNRDLVEFLRRFDMMDRTQRGWDPTVFDASPEEIADFDKAIEDVAGDAKNVLLRSLFASVGDKGKCLRRRIEIPKREGEGERTVSYIVGRSIERARSPTGRVTRGFVAMSMDTKKLVFLKDSWRPNLPGMKGEGQWFERLKGARNVSAFLHGSDVRCVVVRERGRVGAPGSGSSLIQHTLTDVHSEGFRGMKDMMGFRDSKHLTQITLDIVNAIQDLYDRGVIHRDISTENIMISVGGEGRLIDFDLARDRDYIDPRMSVRTGTWQFMSTRLLHKPRKVHELCDDLESLWFVLLFEGLHSAKHNNPSGIDMAMLFDQEHVPPNTGIPTGGVGKWYLYVTDPVINEKLEFESKPFTVLVRGLYQLFQSLDEYYRASDRERAPSDFDLENVKKLENCGEIKRLLTEALDSDDWPEVRDKVDDQYPPNLTPEQMDVVAMGFVNVRLPGGPSKRKRREEEDDVQIPPTQRLRTDVPLLK